MGHDDEFVPISPFMHELRRRYGAQRPLTYQRLWLAITEGHIPARFERNKWWLQRKDLPLAAQVLGLERLTPSDAA